MLLSVILENSVEECCLLYINKTSCLVFKWEQEEKYPTLLCCLLIGIFLLLIINIINRVIKLTLDLCIIDKLCFPYIYCGNSNEQ